MDHDQKIFALAFRIAESMYVKPGQVVKTQAEIMEEAKALDSLFPEKVFRSVEEFVQYYFPLEAELRYEPLSTKLDSQ